MNEFVVKSKPEVDSTSTSSGRIQLHAITFGRESDLESLTLGINLEQPLVLLLPVHYFLSSAKLIRTNSADPNLPDVETPLSSISLSVMPCFIVQTSQWAGGLGGGGCACYSVSRKAN